MDSDSDDHVQEEDVENAWTISITDHEVEQLDFNQSRIHKLQNLDTLSRIQVVF